MKQSYYWARVYNNVVTHKVQVFVDNWTETNPWTNVPGEWIQTTQEVNCEWIYDPVTKTFSAPQR